MVRAVVLAVLATGLAGMPEPQAIRAADKTRQKKEVAAEGRKIAKLLATEKVHYEKNLQKTPLQEVLADLSKKHDLTFVINKAAFPKMAPVLAAKGSNLGRAKLNGLTVGGFLDAYLGKLDIANVTYIVRPDYVEITSLDARLKEKQDRVFPAQAESPAVGIKAGRVQSIVAALQEEQVSYDKDLVTPPLPEVLGDLAKMYNVQFITERSAFEQPAALDDSRAVKLGTSRLDGLTLHSFLQLYLRSLSVPNVTYLVRDGYIEITTLESALKQAAFDEAIEEAGSFVTPTALDLAKARLKLPLVCVVVENRTVKEVFDTLANVYGLNIMIDTAAREQMKTRLTERLLNVPADTAIELLAKQAGLHVVRKGNVFRVTPEGDGF
jgi:hypothetical protein